MKRGKPLWKVFAEEEKMKKKAEKPIRKPPKKAKKQAESQKRVSSGYSQI